MLNSDGPTPRRCAAQMRRKADPMEIDEMAYPADEEYEGDWDEGEGKAKGKANGKGKGKRQAGKGAGRGSGKTSIGKTWQEDLGNFPCKYHNSGQKGHKAAH